VAVGDAVYVSGPGAVDSAEANNIAKKFCIGFVSSKPNSTEAKILTTGLLIGFSGLTPGLPIFLSDSVAGAITQTPITGSGKWIQILGVAADVDKILIQISPPIKRT
jgi:hypothetical protein